MKDVGRAFTKFEMDKHMGYMAYLRGFIYQTIIFLNPENIGIDDRIVVQLCS